MLDQKLWRRGTAKIIRILQILLLSVAAWFIYWSHVYEMTTWNKTFVETFQSSFQNVLLYSISLIAVICLELLSKRSSRPSMGKSSTGIREEVVKEKQMIKQELLRSKQKPSNKIAVALLSIGALVLSYSFISSSTILAFIGLGLSFWGILFLFARATKYVRSTLLGKTAIASYITLDMIIDDLHYMGKATYIPPYPKEAYLPEYLKGLKEMVVFISAKDSTTMPTLEEIAKKIFLIKNPKGMFISPPGFGLVSLFEKELRVDFTKINQESFYDSLPTVIVNNLELASDFEIEAEKELIHVKITDSVYSNLYSKNQNLKSIHSIGCPLASAVACALAKTTGKFVTINSSKISPDLKTLEIWYQTVEG